MNVLYEALIALAVALGIGAASYHAGHVNGENHQKVADQAVFDDINTKIALQKAEANKELAAALTANAQLALERDAIKHQLEVDHVQATAETDALRKRVASLSLRFRAPEGPGRGPSGGASAPAGPNTVSTPAPAYVQLPDQIAADLRELAYDADQLRDDYAACYAETHPVAH